MGKKRVMVPAQEVDLSTVKYEPEAIQAPHLTGFIFKFFVSIIEAPVIGSLLISYLKKKNKLVELLRNTVIPEAPMFKPEFPPQEPEHGVVTLHEDGKPEDRVESALKCLPDYDLPGSWNGNQDPPFKYWKIRDYAYAYRSGLATPSIVAERIIPIIEEFSSEKPPQPLLISFDAEEVRKQAAASTKRFEEGKPLSILDGIFMAIKDDIDCFPHPSKSGSTWMHQVRSVKKDAVCVSRLRSCGVILLGKANMHEFGMGTTGNNPNFGTARNPHAPERYTGGSSSGPAAIVASGLCSAALGTDGGGSIRIPSSLCGVVGFKTTYGRTDMEGSLCDAGTVEIIGPIASTVEDVMLVYAAILGSSLGNRKSLQPSAPCLPILSAHDGLNALESLRIGKYTAWFNDVNSTDISDKCEDILGLLCKAHGCRMVEIVIPELHEMRNAHLVSIGSEMLCSVNPDCEDGKAARMTYDTRTSLALFRSFTASDYVAAQCLSFLHILFRRRIMYHHMAIFKNVDVIVTPTTGMTAPVIPPSALQHGETDMQVTGDLMRFIIAANLLGLPAISVPVGFDKQGLPIGLQLIGRPWGEASLLRVASAIEELCVTSKKRPVSFYDVLRTN
ncbi:fatty acid amide hydrolase isoform X2 [Juglans microcarpa x Juglans regia]|uniref:fatty acid amide hydrolase isoform X2 n=1 Tax=Juglans microcarpa x Juglans regia TaxID=2249226 RepID=UPI001B7EF60F|nr:fatty acid amide hydrolase isoform X2 [Juglans microcarpa x Juglans regia]